MCTATPLLHAAETEPVVLSVSQWREDVTYLSKMVWTCHPDPTIYGPTREEYDLKVTALLKSIPDLGDAELLLEVLKLQAMLNDAHSGTDWKTIDKRILNAKETPFRFYAGRDGWFLMATTEQYARYLGWHLTHVGGHRVDDVIRMIIPLVSGDNLINRRTHAGQRLNRAALLHTLGVLQDGDSITYRLRSSDGTMMEVTAEARAQVNGSQLLELFDAAKSPLPLWRKNAGRDYWFEVVSEHQLVYVQCNRIRNAEEESMYDFTKRLFECVDAQLISKFILDLRQNPGGDPELAWPLIHQIAMTEKINQTGKLFVIVGRGTKSAAPTTAVRLQNLSHAIIVGEPTAGRPNGFGNAYTFTLPNSGLTMRCSTLYMQPTALPDRRPWITPDLSAEITADDYRYNRDPAIKAIVDFKLVDSLLDVAGGISELNTADRVIDSIKRFRHNHQNKWIYIMDDVDKLGHGFLTAGKIDDAIAVFEFNARQYPYSSIVHSSLAEAFLAQGHRVRAIESYRTSLRKTRNTKALDGLRQLDALNP